MSVDTLETTTMADYTTRSLDLFFPAISTVNPSETTIDLEVLRAQKESELLQRKYDDQQALHEKPREERGRLEEERRRIAIRRIATEELHRMPADYDRRQNYRVRFAAEQRQKLKTTALPHRHDFPS